jgi:hypothetical protein
VGHRASLDTEDRGTILLPLPGIEPRWPGRPARGQTLYCLSYSAHNRCSVDHFVYRKKHFCYNGSHPEAGENVTMLLKFDYLFAFHLSYSYDTVKVSPVHSQQVDKTLDLSVNI